METRATCVSWFNASSGEEDGVRVGCRADHRKVFTKPPHPSPRPPDPGSWQRPWATTIMGPLPSTLEGESRCWRANPQRLQERLLGVWPSRRRLSLCLGWRETLSPQDPSRWLHRTMAGAEGLMQGVRCCLEEEPRVSVARMRGPPAAAWAREKRTHALS